MSAIRRIRSSLRVVFPALIWLGVQNWAAAAAAETAAAAAGAVTSHLTVLKVVVEADNREHLVEASTVRPGDVVEYRVVYTNRGDTPIAGLRPVLPIPRPMAYLPGTARPATAEASLDGVTYGAVPLKRSVKDADGTTREEPVPYEDYRFLRWNLGDLPPGGEVAAGARARVMK